MNKCRFIKCGISLMLLVILLTVTACGKEQAAVKMEPMEEEEVHAVSIDFLGGQDVMPISGFHGPYATAISFDAISLPDYFTDEIFQALSECGINMVHHAYADYEEAREQVIKMLELGEKYNVGIFVFDSQICYRVGESALSLKEMDERINLYRDYPAFSGMYVVDEPGTSYFKPELTEEREVSDYVPVFQNLKELGVVGSGNLCPVWYDYEHESYNQYVEEYISTCEPPYISFDYYVFDPERSVAGYFYNMDVIRHYAEKYEIPFWLYVQAGGQWNDGMERFDSIDYFPTEGQLHWNVNTALAYGAKGIEYFPLIQPYHFSWAASKEHDFQRNGILGVWGNKTQWWHYAKSVNKQIAAVDGVLMNAVNKGVIVSGKKAIKDTAGGEFIMEGTAWRELKDVKGNAMIGCFNYKGKSALYVVNYETEYAQKVTLKLQDSYNMSVTQDAEVSTVNAKNITLDLKAGEGALIVFE